MLERLFRVVNVIGFDDQRDRNVFTVGPGLSDVLLGHSVDVFEIRVAAALDDTPANLRFRVGIVEINQRDGDARITLRVAAFYRAVVRCDKKAIAFTPDPDCALWGEPSASSVARWAKLRPSTRRMTSAESLADMTFSSVIFYACMKKQTSPESDLAHGHHRSMQHRRTGVHHL